MKLYLKSSCSSYLNSTCLPTCSGFQESSIVPVYLHVPAFRRKFTLCSRNIYIFFLKELYISIIVCQIFCNLSKENKVSWDNCDSWEMTTSPQNLSMRSFSPQIWSHNKKNYHKILAKLQMQRFQSFSISIQKQFSCNPDLRKNPNFQLCLISARNFQNLKRFFLTSSYNCKAKLFLGLFC